MEGRPPMERRSTIKYAGMEGKFVSKDSFEGRKIAVFTSGGDAQGMNSAVRAVVRMGLYLGSKMFCIHEGYQGIVDGGQNIVEASWADVSGIMHRGGTVIGSARCKDFQTREGRLKGAANLIKHGITNLVCIGGDGSLTGANLFKNEWSSLLDELLEKGIISKEKRDEHSYLNIVGLVGSIDNDFYGTDMTIGADSALHRIIEATDAISVTAHSHQRCFIMEVMGRHCGYLALVASLASEADWVFIPESPPPEDWKKRLCDKLSENRCLGQRVNIIIIAEGAVDSDCNPISSSEVKDLISTELKLDTRVTVLGHVQRGGSPSAFDRILGIRMGAEAVLALMDAERNRDLPACVVTLDGNQTIRMPLMRCVEKTRSIAEAMKNKDWAKATELRGKSFNNNLEMYLKLAKINPNIAQPTQVTDLLQFLHRREFRVSLEDADQDTWTGASDLACLTDFELQDTPVMAIINVGAPSCGVNAAMRSFIRLGIVTGYNVVGVLEGFDGLVADKLKPMRWTDVRGWVSLGGSALGSRRARPQDIGVDRVAAAFKKHKIAGLLVIGGFEAFECMIAMYEARKTHAEFCIPMAMLPATISNNVPGTEFSLGADTSLNEITTIIDKLKQSALGTKRRVFIMETMGGYCGYLATLSGLAGGADAAYIHEEPFTIDDLRQDVVHLRAKIEDDVQRGLVIVCENASKNYTANFIHQLYAEEGKGIFDCRINVPGHMQQGGVSSPFDRNMGTKMGAKALDYLHKMLSTGKQPFNQPESCVLVGILKRHTEFTPVEKLKEISDLVHRTPNQNWWLLLRPLMRIMAKHDSLYESDSIMLGAEKVTAGTRTIGPIQEEMITRP
ncbi:hypothetical protein Ciccas_006055 [Cichlidogyrus casuarinus]|uniref:ATP-dependent 6-phosphofructokinase n=1 Tax=Cichlidogyrus casuarinus TaxID=1844966 RepID=A0ABD2Q817_9PLAT